MAASDTRVVEDTRRIAAFAAFGMAAAMLFIPFPILLGVVLGVRPPAGASFSAQDSVAAIVAHPIIFASSGLSFTILGLSLIALALALHEHLRGAAPFAARVATAAGVIGGAMLMLVGLGPVTMAKGLPGIDEQYRVAVNLANFLVASRLTTGGMFMLGVFVLIASLAGARVGLVGRALSYLGVLLGITAVIGNVLPGPLQFAAGPLILIWSAWLGVALLRAQRRIAPAPGTPAPARA